GRESTAGLGGKKLMHRPPISWAIILAASRNKRTAPAASRWRVATTPGETWTLQVRGPTGRRSQGATGTSRRRSTTTEHATMTPGSGDLSQRTRLILLAVSTSIDTSQAGLPF